MKSIWPALLAVSLQAVSPRDCAPCHAQETAHFAQSAMTRALESAADCAILKANPLLTASLGGYSYRIERQGNASIYTVTDGKDTIKAPIEWAFGLGAAGQTYLFQREGQWYESRVSYYTAIKGLDITIGARDAPARNLDEAAGRRTARADAAQCFNCHATRAVEKRELNLTSMIQGIQCERCHGDSEMHLAAVRSGDTAHAGMRKLSGLSTEDLSDYCGECHRTWSQIAATGPRGIGNVRFQPYRLQSSRCYDSEDRRIRCTACHEPHSEVKTDPAAYDANCKACHTRNAAPATKASLRICKVDTKNCTGCHMPKLELPGSHRKFSDHEIRIARANEKYPD